MFLECFEGLIGYGGGLRIGLGWRWGEDECNEAIRLHWKFQTMKQLIDSIRFDSIHSIPTRKCPPSTFTATISMNGFLRPVRLG